MSTQLGGELATRPLHFIWILDCSGSMATNGKIQSLNSAIREAIPLMKQVADANPNAHILVRAIIFSSGAQWHIDEPIAVEDFKWDDLRAGGTTDMGKALSMVAEQLRIPPMTDRALPPVLVLISDGQPTDDFKGGLAALMEQLDHSSAPVPRAQPNPIASWPIYPAYLHGLFIRAFTDGIHDPQNGRVREGEWRAAMVKLSDSIVICANCSAENFYDASIQQTAGVIPGTCWSCQRGIILPPQLRIGSNTLILNSDTRIFPHHIDIRRLYDFSQPVGEVTRHPTHPRVWGLKNLSEEKWTVTVADGTLAEVLPGRSLTLKTGIRSNFCKVEGHIGQN